MTGFEFRVLFGNQPAPRELLQAIDEITVEQEIGMAWEGRIRIPIHADERGTWTGQDESYLVPFGRARIEIRPPGGDFKALVDGPVVGFDSRMSSEPEGSSVTLIVRDDSASLNRRDGIEVFEDVPDHRIAEQIYSNTGTVIASYDVDPTPDPPGTLPRAVVRRGTEMELLKYLAGRQGMYAYVLPGKKPGQSIGCFKALPAKSDGLPPLVLLGADRNTESFRVRYDALLPASLEASMLMAEDKSLVSAVSDFSRISLLGAEGAYQGLTGDATQVLRPDRIWSADVERAVAAGTERACYAYEATGSTLSDGYPDVLQPYRIVVIRGANARLSGEYLIRKVRHTITRSGYVQAFTLIRNARSDKAEPDGR